MDFNSFVENINQDKLPDNNLYDDSDDTNTDEFFDAFSLFGESEMSDRDDDINDYDMDDAEDFIDESNQLLYPGARITVG